MKTVLIVPKEKTSVYTKSGQPTGEMATKSEGFTSRFSYPETEDKREIAHLQREVETLTIARNDYQRQVAELMKRVSWLEKQRKSGK